MPSSREESPWRFKVSRHARMEMEKRGIPLRVLEEVLKNPQQVVAGWGGTTAYQSKHDFGGRMFLIRAVVNEAVDPPVVVTVYRTSKISRCWRTP